MTNRFVSCLLLPLALAPGWYVYGVRLAASMNPSRTALLVASPFRVG